MLKEFTCIICPNGCEIEADVEDGKILSLTGAVCSKGEDYVSLELTDPQRNIATSVLGKEWSPSAGQCTFDQSV